MVQITTGHGFVKYHLFNTGRAADLLCRKSAWHLLAKCPAMAGHRLAMMYMMRIQPWNIQPPCLKNFVMSKAVQTLVGFPDEVVVSQTTSAEATQ